jgi:hypothetical protein
MWNKYSENGADILRSSFWIVSDGIGISRGRQDVESRGTWTELNCNRGSVEALPTLHAIWGSHGAECKDYGLLRCEAM